MYTTRETQTRTRAVVGATLVSVFLGMLVYTGIEYLFRSPVHLTEFFTHHFLPALLIGVIVSITVVLLLERSVVAPPAAY